MCISDWSSDVCSSDLLSSNPAAMARRERELRSRVCDVNRQVGIVGGVVIENGAPAFTHQPYFAPETRYFLQSIVCTARGGLMVIHRREWRPCIAVSRFAHAQAEIDIVEGDLQALVESSDLLKDLPAHKPAGPGHRRQVLRAQDRKRTRLTSSH